MRRLVLSRFALELARMAAMRRLRLAAVRDEPDLVLSALALIAPLAMLSFGARAVLWLAFGRPRRSALIAAELAQLAVAELSHAWRGTAGNAPVC